MSVVSKMTRMLSALQRSPDASAARLAADLGEPVTSVYRILGHLEGIGWVEKGPARGQYRLGIDLADVAQSVETSLDIRQLASPVLLRLNGRTREVTYLCVRHDRRAVCIERFDGADIQSAEFPLGGSLPLHRGAGPLAILAFESEEFRRRYIAALAAADTNPLTEADVVELERALRSVRSRGVAVSDGDVTPGILTAAAPVFDHRGSVVGSVSLSGLRDRAAAPGVDFPALIVEAGQQISAGLGATVGTA
ncbi:IclR family transcriptional regulator [Nakamurella leprariae]|uniref:IclR family transcriptional regulator n=1 Tax=Nakamurella leprariae TaxID=2803911 RepID=A0A938YI18_9ACTN|nr:IclR family transcriptional regulator [Nakamurella leprariae]MBM9468539.1 IclR family transcriptional regulator [Nakamurella leprariae]